MKKEKSLVIAGVFALFAIVITSCGDGGKAAREKASQDSIRVADSLMEVRRVADSIAASLAVIKLALVVDKSVANVAR